ncbi:MAG: hypothetical protein ACRDGM_11700 [bacterium]
MNAAQLKKNIGQLVRLRPKARRPTLVPDYNAVVNALRRYPTRQTEQQLLEEVDYEWRIENVTEDKNVVLYCIATDHKITLGADNIREYRTPHFLMLRCRLILDGPKVHVEPVVHIEPI